MTTTDSYHTQMVAPEQSPHASGLPADSVLSAPSAPSGDFPTNCLLINEQISSSPEEDEAWDYIAAKAGCAE